MSVTSVHGDSSIGRINLEGSNRGADKGSVSGGRKYTLLDLEGVSEEISSRTEAAKGQGPIMKQVASETCKIVKALLSNKETPRNDNKLSELSGRIQRFLQGYKSSSGILHFFRRIFDSDYRSITKDLKSAQEAIEKWEGEPETVAAFIELEEEVNQEEVNKALDALWTKDDDEVGETEAKPIEE